MTRDPELTFFDEFGDIPDNLDFYNIQDELNIQTTNTLTQPFSWEEDLTPQQLVTSTNNATTAENNLGQPEKQFEFEFEQFMENIPSPQTNSTPNAPEISMEMLQNETSISMTSHAPMTGQVGVEYVTLQSTETGQISKVNISQQHKILAELPTTFTIIELPEDGMDIQTHAINGNNVEAANLAPQTATSTSSDYNTNPGSICSSIDPTEVYMANMLLEESNAGTDNIPQQKTGKRTTRTKRINTRGPKRLDWNELPEENWENVQRCRDSREKKKAKMGKEEKELMELEAKNIELRKKEKVHRLMLEKARAGYLRLIKEGRIKVIF